MNLHAASTLQPYLTGPSLDRDDRLDFQRFERCALLFPALEGRRQEGELKTMFWNFRLAEQLCLAEPMDYFKYEFYRRDCREWRQFLTRRQFAQLSWRWNRPEDRAVFADKARFLRRFQQCLGRDTLAAVPENQGAFTLLCRKHKKLMIKPRSGGYGLGIQIVDTGNPKALWALALEGRCVLEEVVEQHGLMAVAHSRSVNTVRLAVATTPEGTPVILGAVFRCGRGRAITDNDQGLFCQVDPDRGAVCSQGMDHFGQRYACHPDTGFRFQGFQVPCWDRLYGAVCHVMAQLPQLRLITLDWALRCDGRWVLIEGNTDGGLGPCQEASGQGLAPQVQAVLGGNLEEG